MLNIGVVVPDPEVNGKHIPFAKSQLRAFARDWRGLYMSRTLIVEDATILMEVWTEQNGRITILSRPIYMESGYLRPGSYALFDPNTYKPATVLFGPRERANAANTGPDKLLNARGHILADGDETWTAAGCKPDDKVGSVTVQNPLSGEEQTFLSGAPEFCDQSLIFERKQLTRFFPPSAFTGKLRLLVQAMYGSDRTDLKLEADVLGGGVFSIKRGETSIPLSTGVPTTGLITVSPGKYLLVTVPLTGQITYRKMLPFASRTFDQPEDEAYWLSALVPSTTTKTAEGPDLDVPGGPIAYGWHFSKSGMRAAICTCTDKLISGLQLVLGNPSRIRGLEFISSEIGFTYADDVLNYSVTAGVTGEHIPFVQSKIWYPAGGRMLCLTPNDSTPWNVHTFCNADVYCYFEGETPIYVNATTGALTLTAPKPMPVNINQLAGVFGPFAEPPPMRREYFSHEGRTLLGQSGFELTTGQLETGTSFYEPFGGVNEEFLLVEGTRVNFIDLYPPTNAPGPAWDYRYAVGTPARLSMSYAGRFEEEDTVLIIPNGEAEAVVLGYRKSRKFENYTITSYSLNNNVSWSRRSSLFPDPTVPVPFPVGFFWGSPSFFPPVFRSSDFNGVGAFVSARLRVVSKGGSYIITDSTTEGFSSSEGLDLIFKPGFFEIELDSMDVRTAYFGNTIKHSGIIQSDKTAKFINDWPDGGGETPIGWA